MTLKCQAVVGINNTCSDDATHEVDARVVIDATFDMVESVRVHVCDFHAGVEAEIRAADAEIDEIVMPANECPACGRGGVVVPGEEVVAHTIPGTWSRCQYIAPTGGGFSQGPYR